MTKELTVSTETKKVPKFAQERLLVIKKREVNIELEARRSGTIISSLAIDASKRDGVKKDGITSFECRTSSITDIKMFNAFQSGTPKYQMLLFDITYELNPRRKRPQELAVTCAPLAALCNRREVNGAEEFEGQHY